MEGKQGIISLKAFLCHKCKNIALEPCTTDCCEAIICLTCYNISNRCPVCERAFRPKFSQLLNNIYKNVICECPFNCYTRTILHQLKIHMETCPEMTKACIYCKQIIKVKLFPDHLGQRHKQECNGLLLGFHKIPSDVQQEKAIPEKLIPFAQPFRVGTTGIQNVDPRISQKGKMFCGRPKFQQSASSSFLSSPFQNRKQACCPEQGNCNNCMKLDIDRFGLPKNYFLNMEGRICFYIVEKKKVACGSKGNSKICNEEVQCDPCRRLLYLIQKGLYQDNLIAIRR